MSFFASQPLPTPLSRPPHPSCLRLPPPPQRKTSCNMLSLARSRTELDFIEAGVAQDVRADGRRRIDYREISVAVDVHPSANGSARVILGQGATEVLAVVKAELSQPSHEHPKRGKLEVNIEVSPLALLHRETARDGEDLNADLTKAFETFLIRAEALDMEALCITPGRFSWTVYLDVLILEGQGNLLDTISFAAYAALRTARLPKIDAISGGLDAANDPIEDFELSSTDITEAIGLPIKNLPICISLNRIGNFLVVDTAADEEAEGGVKGRVTVAVDETGHVCGIHKGAGGGFPARELQGMTQHVVPIALKVLEGLKAVLGLKEGGNGNGQEGISGEIPR